VIDENLHPFARIHIPAGIDIDRYAAFLRKGMQRNMGFFKSVDDCNTLRVKLMRESIEDCCSAYLNGTFERGFDSCKIIQQIERDAIKAN
jgi:hypothetical protein